MHRYCFALHCYRSRTEMCRAFDCLLHVQRYHREQTAQRHSLESWDHPVRDQALGHCREEDAEATVPYSRSLH